MLKLNVTGILFSSASCFEKLEEILFLAGDRDLNERRIFNNFGSHEYLLEDGHLTDAYPAVFVTLAYYMCELIRGAAQSVLEQSDHFWMDPSVIMPGTLTEARDSYGRLVKYGDELVVVYDSVYQTLLDVSDELLIRNGITDA